MTTGDRALTRVCDIDLIREKVVYDQLVRPSRLSHPVSSHLSFFSLMSYPNFSRITATSLDPVTNTLADLQMYLRTLIKTCTSFYSIQIHIPEAVARMRIAFINHDNPEA